MDRTPVSSRSVRSIGFEPETLTLEVEFVKSGIYQYFGVPVELYEQLMASPSKGTFVNEQIKKGGYAVAKVP